MLKKPFRRLSRKNIQTLLVLIFITLNAIFYKLSKLPKNVPTGDLVIYDTETKNDSVVFRLDEQVLTPHDPNLTCEEHFRLDMAELQNHRFPLTESEISHVKLRRLLNTLKVNNGCWQPDYCKITQRLAVVVPYRQRKLHINTFLYNIHRFLIKQHRSYCVIFSEQYDKGNFNRGKLLNTGFLQALKHPYFEKEPDCFVFQDIDLIPENYNLLYGCLKNRAVHLCDKFNKMNYETQFNSGGRFSSGGAVSVSREQYVKANGHPNWIWGYGEEDIYMTSRLYKMDMNVLDDPMEKYIREKDLDTFTTRDNATALGISRADKYGYYTMLTHSYGYSNGKGPSILRTRYDVGENLGAKQIGKVLSSLDGLNTTSYTLTSTHQV